MSHEMDTLQTSLQVDFFSSPVLLSSHLHYLDTNSVAHDPR